jgi:hypothetical protein
VVQALLREVNAEGRARITQQVCVKEEIIHHRRSPGVLDAVVRPLPGNVPWQAAVRDPQAGLPAKPQQGLALSVQCHVDTETLTNVWQDGGDHLPTPHIPLGRSTSAAVKVASYRDVPGLTGPQHVTKEAAKELPHTGGRQAGRHIARRNM